MSLTQIAGPGFVVIFSSILFGACSDGETEQSETQAAPLLTTSGTTNANGVVELALNEIDRSISINVIDESENPVSGISVKYTSSKDGGDFVVVYDDNGQYFPNAIWGSKLTTSETGSASTIISAYQTSKQPLPLAALVVIGLATTAYTIYQSLTDPPPIQYDHDGRNFRFCGSREWFMREAELATGVIFMGINDLVGVAAGKLTGFGMLALLDGEYDGEHSGYIVVYPTNEPNCESNNIINDLCIYNDASHGLKIWDRAPLEIKIDGPCDPSGSNGYKVKECQQGEKWLDMGNGVIKDCDNTQYQPSGPILGLFWRQELYESQGWSDAESYCNNLSIAGYSDWRLPNEKELIRLMRQFDTETDCACCPVLPFEGSCNSCKGCWSSENSQDFPGEKKYASFPSCRMDSYLPDTGYHVRCVRK